MSFVFDFKASDSPFVEGIWRTQSTGGGTFMSAAASNWEMVITKQYGKTTLSIRGPETKASPAPIPEDAEFLGITLKIGTFMPEFPVNCLLNDAIHLPETSGKSFWLAGSTWQFPDFENVDTFLNRLARGGLLAHEPVVEAALQGQISDLSLRSAQRRILRATGLTHSTIRQIERARRAMTLLQQGVSILDTVYEAGYTDQSHLTRSLKLFIGHTPAQLLRVGT